MKTNFFDENNAIKYAGYINGVLPRIFQFLPNLAEKIAGREINPAWNGQYAKIASDKFIIEEVAAEAFINSFGGERGLAPVVTLNLSGVFDAYYNIGDETVYMDKKGYLWEASGEEGAKEWKKVAPEEYKENGKYSYELLDFVQNTKYSKSEVLDLIEKKEIPSTPPKVATALDLGVKPLVADGQAFAIGTLMANVKNKFISFIGKATQIVSGILAAVHAVDAVSASITGEGLVSDKLLASVKQTAQDFAKNQGLV